MDTTNQRKCFLRRVVTVTQPFYDKKIAVINLSTDSTYASENALKLKSTSSLTNYGYVSKLS